jgi:hypothetical protein
MPAASYRSDSYWLRTRVSRLVLYFFIFLAPWPENLADAKYLKYLGVLNGISVLKMEY